MKPILTFVAFVSLWLSAIANSPLPDGANILPDAKRIQVVATLKEFALEAGLLEAALGANTHFDLLIFQVSSPREWKGRRFTIWVPSPHIPRSAAEKGKATAYWKQKVGCEIDESVDEQVFSERDVFRCIWPQESLKFRKPNQPPQRNAGSRPSSGDSPASETPSSLGPRG